MNLANRKELVQSAAAQRKADSLDYIRQMLRELRDMTAAEDEVFIAYLINMAYFATSDLIRTRYANLVPGNQSPKEVGNGSAFQGP